MSCQLVEIKSTKLAVCLITYILASPFTPVNYNYPKPASRGRPIGQATSLSTVSRDHTIRTPLLVSTAPSRLTKRAVGPPIYRHPETITNTHTEQNLSATNGCWLSRLK